MKGHRIIVADADIERLSSLVEDLKCSFCRDQQQLEMLDQTLESAEVMPLDRISRDVIRMNSCIRVRDLDTRKKGLYTLVLPEDANISGGLISVLAPLGIALLGHKKGDVIEAKVPGGTRRLRVEQVRFRPETGGKKLSGNRSPRRTDYLRRNQEPCLAI